MSKPCFECACSARVTFRVGALYNICGPQLCRMLPNFRIASAVSAQTPYVIARPLPHIETKMFVPTTDLPAAKSL